MTEDIPQTARAMFLRSIWPKQIDRFLDPVWIDARETHLSFVTLLSATIECPCGLR